MICPSACDVTGPLGLSTVIALPLWSSLPYDPRASIAGSATRPAHKPRRFICIYPPCLDTRGDGVSMRPDIWYGKVPRRLNTDERSDAAAGILTSSGSPKKLRKCTDDGEARRVRLRNHWGGSGRLCPCQSS